MTTPLAHEESVRHRLHGTTESTSERYARFVIGGLEWPRLLKYELITTILGPIPGALGLVLRRTFYPLLFEDIGEGVTFGRNIVLRHPHRIRIGNGVFLDDECLVDGRGAGTEGIVLEDRVVIGRGAYVQSKMGPIRIGRDSVVGRGAMIVSQGGIDIAERVSIAGGCKISGGMFRIPPGDQPIEHYSNGPVRIGPGCVLTMGATVLDNVTIGEGTLVGAGAVVSSDLPARSVASPRPPLVLGSSGRETDPAEPAPEANLASSDGSSSSRTLAAVLAAVEEINLQLSPENRLALSPDTALHGEHGALDSLRLVNLLVSVEEKIEDTYGAPLSLSDVATGSGAGESPLATVANLARYIDDLRSQ